MLTFGGLPGCYSDQTVCLELWEVICQEILVLADARHGLLSGQAQSFEDQVQLIINRRAWEQRSSAGHLVKYTAYTPEEQVTHSS